MQTLMSPFDRLVGLVGLCLATVSLAGLGQGCNVQQTRPESGAWAARAQQPHAPRLCRFAKQNFRTITVMDVPGLEDEAHALLGDPDDMPCLKSVIPKVGRYGNQTTCDVMRGFLASEPPHTDADQDTRRRAAKLFVRALADMAHHRKQDEATRAYALKTLMTLSTQAFWLHTASTWPARAGQGDQYVQWLRRRAITRLGKLASPAVLAHLQKMAASTHGLGAQGLRALKSAIDRQMRVQGQSSQAGKAGSVVQARQAD